MKIRYQLFVNGRFLEEYKTEQEAINDKTKYERNDRYEQSIGYTNPLSTYEIKKVVY